MGTLPRKRSAGDVYHLIVRGVGKQIIFEDEADRAFFFETMRQQAARREVKVLAWCTMSNHVHLLAQAPIAAISRFMACLQSSYALYFNKRHNRVGKLFQGRFTSVPVESDEQLITVVRYIHLNPVKAGEPLDSPWSSYAALAAGGNGIEGSSLVLSAFGGKVGFKKSHDDHADVVRPSIPRTRLSESEAIELARQVVAPRSLHDVKSLPKAERNDVLRQLKSAGLSVRQATRCTGIGQNIVARA